MHDVFEKIIQDMIGNGFSVTESFFEKEILIQLRLNLKQLLLDQEMIPAMVGRGSSKHLDHEVRSDVTHWMEGSLDKEKNYQENVEVLIEFLNRTCYSNIKASEFYYIHYGIGNYYKKHKDAFKGEAGRQFSMITYLNDGWTAEDGGELVLFINGEEIIILPEFGKTVIFKSDEIDHEVRPALRPRMSITGWLK